MTFNGKSAVATILFILISPQLDAQVVSPFNQRKMDCGDTPGMTFLVGSHFHGASSNQGLFPASSLLANLDTINSLGSDFFISLGDMFIDCNDSVLRNYENSFFRKLQIPLLNAPGNHDLSTLYKKKYQPLFSRISCKASEFVLLNTEAGDGNITGEQLQLLKEALSSEAKNILVFSHRTVFTENDPDLEPLFEGNTSSVIGYTNFKSTILPLLRSSGKNVYWFAGSMGNAPFSFFYHKDRNLTYIVTGIRDLPRDGIIKVNISDSGGVSFTPVSFTGQKLLPLESYNLNLWRRYKNVKQDKFNYRLLPYYTFLMFKTWQFWTGLFLGLLFSFLLILRLRRKRHK